MNRDDAWALLNEYTKSDSLLKHALAVEAAVRGYARKFGEDEEAWGVTALLHDFDYERWPTLGDHPNKGAASSVKKRMKDKAFARGVKREDLIAGAELLGLPLEEHFTNVIEFIREKADVLGLRGTL